MSVKNEAVTGITKDDLLEVIRIAREPVVTDREKREMAQIQEESKVNAAFERQKIANRSALQKVCNHAQDNGLSDKSAVVFINQDFPNAPGRGQYLFCQNCGIKLVAIPLPENARDYSTDYVYDPALFNQLFQKLRLSSF